MKAIIFDSGTLISLSMNGLLNDLVDLKNIFDGKFLITADVKREVVDKPLKIKRFELEALRVRNLLEQKVLEMPESVEVSEREIGVLTKEFLEVANSSFSAKGRSVHIIDSGEASCLALSRLLTKKGVNNLLAVDERTTRLLCEKPENLKKFLYRKIHSDVEMRRQNYALFDGIKIIRSTELMHLAHKKGLLDLKDSEMLDAVLYALKYKGCAISEEEIKALKKI